MNRATQTVVTLTLSCLVGPALGETVQWRPATSLQDSTGSSAPPVRLTRPQPLLPGGAVSGAQVRPSASSTSTGGLRPVFRARAEDGFTPLPQGPYSAPATPLPGQPLYLAPGCSGAVPCCPLECCPGAGTPFCENNSCQTTRLEVGLGFYFLRPHWDDAAAFNLTTTTPNLFVGGAVQDISTSQTNLSFDSSFAPKIWAAYSTEDGLTGRLSYFYLDSTTSNSVQQAPDTPTTSTILVLPGGRDPISALIALAPGSPPPFADSLGLFGFLLAPGQANVASIDARLRLQSIDFDVTQQCQLGCWSLNIGGGVRYARLEQTYNAYVNLAGIPGGGLARNTLHLSNVFEGVGVQAVAEVKRPLGMGLGLSVYGNARAGILFGESRQNNTASIQTDAAGAPFVGSVGPTYLVNRRSVTQDDSLPYVELEAGLEWSQNFSGVNPFARVGVVGQQWFGTGSPSSSSYNRHGDLGLFGLQVAAGVRY